MPFIILTIVASISIQPLSAQVGSPFDLAPRLDTTRVVIPQAQLPPSRVASQPRQTLKRNPFDLARKEASSNSSEQPSIKLPAVISEANKVESVENRGTFDTILSFGLLVFLALATVLRGGALRKIFSSALNSNLLNQLQREQRKLGYYLWAALGILVLGSFCFVTARHLYPDLMPYGWSTLGWFVLSVLVLTGLKLLSLELLKSIFPLRKVVSSYQTLIVVYAGVISVCLLPAVILINFGTSGLATFVAYLGLAIIGLVYGSRSFRALIDSSRTWTSYPFHFVLYLCALEIGPLAVAFKLLTA